MSRRPVSPALPYDEAAEAALVGGALVWPDRIEAVAAGVEPSDFYVPVHAALWEAIGSLLAEGTKPNAVLAADRVRLFGGAADDAVLLALGADALPPDRALAMVVLRHAAARRALGVVREVEAGIASGVDPYALAADAAVALDAVSSASNGDRAEALTMEELVARAETAAPWIIPDLVRRDWRVLVVAAEGVGKSTLLRQLGVCAAQGIHPLRHDSIEPVSVLLVDAENSLAAVAETGARLDSQARRHAGDRYEPCRLRVWSRPGGLDLRNPKIRGALVSELRRQRPQLVCAGPIYKLGGRRDREGYEDVAEGIQQVWDDLRVRFEFGLVLEHHAPKAAAGSRRYMAPFGSQRWLAWPEIGIGMYAERDGSGLRLERFRGDRMASSWPDRLVRGDVWPFVGVWGSRSRRPTTAQA